MKKDTLLKGTLILAAAALVARALGVFQRVPLEYLLGNKGDGYYSVANNVYLLLLVIATAGIPSAISKMVSERHALGREEEARQVYRAALLFGGAAGIVITLALYAMAPWLAESIIGRPGAASAIRAIAPALLLFPTIAMMRGYFQGRQYMMAGGLSQIVEQILRVAAAVAIAFTLYSWNKNDEWIAAGASFGSVLGSIGAFAVMLYYAKKLRNADRQDQPNLKPAVPLARSLIYREMLRLSVPIVLTAVTVQLMYTLDSLLVVPLTEHRWGAVTAEQWWGILGNRAQSVAGIPVILAIALSQSIIPVISSAHAVGDNSRVGRQSSLAIRLALYSGLPIVLLLTIGAYSVNGALFSSAEGSGIVAMLTFGTLFQITMMVTNSILLGLGQPKKAMMHAFAGIILKVILSFALAPWFGVYGIVAATTICFLSAMIFNIMSIQRLTELRIVGDRWPGFIATTASLGAAVGLIQWLMLTVSVGLPDKLSFLLTSAVLGIVVAGFYPVLLVMLKVVTAEEVAIYPRPVRRLLAPVLKLRAKTFERGM
ncbi:membrane protein [Cohnella kolymensis]|uniref:Membrane protein n=1 Tax=Cohnella kolymensis TaxID=1590652 RepID=A0ABR5A6T4_9BACL|nr:polysaccharide biosynthesis protein [Cohnella kolymensis]KIL36132.1 membrane protein [Cohnella kolymensis]